jgi:hypothetical protein
MAEDAAKNVRKNKWPQMNADENKMLIRVYLRSSAALMILHST